MVDTGDDYLSAGNLVANDIPSLSERNVVLSNILARRCLLPRSAELWRHQKRTECFPNDVLKAVGSRWVERSEKQIEAVEIGECFNR